jgi:hypothetical protein
LIAQCQKIWEFLRKNGIYGGFKGKFGEVNKKKSEINLIFLNRDSIRSHDQEVNVKMENEDSKNLKIKILHNHCNFKWNSSVNNWN